MLVGGCRGLVRQVTERIALLLSFRLLLLLLLPPLLLLLKGPLGLGVLLRRLLLLLPILQLTYLILLRLLLLLLRLLSSRRAGAATPGSAAFRTEFVDLSQKSADDGLFCEERQHGRGGARVLGCRSGCGGRRCSCCS